MTSTPTPATATATARPTPLALASLKRPPATQPPAPAPAQHPRQTLTRTQLARKLSRAHRQAARYRHMLKKERALTHQLTEKLKTLENNTKNH